MGRRLYEATAKTMAVFLNGPIHAVEHAFGIVGQHAQTL